MDLSIKEIYNTAVSNVRKKFCTVKMCNVIQWSHVKIDFMTSWLLHSVVRSLTNNYSKVPSSVP